MSSLSLSNTSTSSNNNNTTYEFKIIYSKQGVTIYPTDGDSKGIEGVISLYYSYDTTAPVLSPSKASASDSESLLQQQANTLSASTLITKSVILSWTCSNKPVSTPVSTPTSSEDDDPVETGGSSTTSTTTSLSSSYKSSNPLARSQPISIGKGKSTLSMTSSIEYPTQQQQQQYQHIKINTKDIHSIKKYTPTIGTPYLIVLSRNGTALPPFFFENGGVKEFITAIRSVNPNLKKSTLDNNLYMMMMESSDLAEIQTSSSLKRSEYLSPSGNPPIIGASYSLSSVVEQHSTSSTSRQTAGLASPSSINSSTVSMSPNTSKTPLSNSHGSTLDTETTVSTSPNTLTPTSGEPGSGGNITAKRRLTKEISSNILDSFTKVSLFAKNAQRNILEEPAKKIDNHFRNITFGSRKTSPQHSNNTSLNSSLNSSSDFFTPFNLSTSIDEPAVNRNECNPLSANEWYSYFDEEGRISLASQQIMQKKIFYGGVHESIRAEVWPFLLQFYPYDSTHSMREVIKYEKTREYYTIKKQWQSITADQESRFSKYSSRKNLIEKDVIRTDRTHPMFQGVGMDNPNSVLIKEILLTYSFYNFDIGYVQGMSDMLTIIYSVIQKEVESFWCFVGLMSRMEINFHKDQNGMHSQLNTLSKLLKFIDQDLYCHFENIDGTNMYFFFQSILICFKREFPFDQVKTLWEVLWSNYMTKQLPIFMCLSILVKERTSIIEDNLQYDQVLKLINGRAGKMDVDDILSFSESVINCFIAKVSAAPDSIDQTLRVLCESIYQY
ncbi:hypothetical protein SAMD00019534_112680 [Acytostelium subglobosum LB1]|uniref:hypothetical protein n=1 Tax=Acytostelium subglobosum LB1 TaxID=1410327 RepID=UPI000644B7BD|nr:hypothetical protein SAMD00019534_112680 [Acytostelium subglobosum LB1]GAM28092.1 hypothetical protein SAMD00019534_112680 [Acytostelium subglobosum LB1]|eukprot:XP_012749051.1 hypothetical protein SAMD00019534_112680 [Acytostelium subglobosum LB1]